MLEIENFKILSSKLPKAERFGSWNYWNLELRKFELETVKIVKLKTQKPKCESWFENETRKRNSKVVTEIVFWNRYLETKLESYYWNWFLKAKLGGETGNLCLKIKLKKETRKLVLRDKTKKREKFNQPTTNSLAQTGVNR